MENFQVSALYFAHYGPQMVDHVGCAVIDGNAQSMIVCILLSLCVIDYPHRCVRPHTLTELPVTSGRGRGWRLGGGVGGGGGAERVGERRARGCREFIRRRASGSPVSRLYEWSKATSGTVIKTTTTRVHACR